MQARAKNLQLLKTEMEKNPIKHLILPANVDDIVHITQSKKIHISHDPHNQARKVLDFANSRGIAWRQRRYCWIHWSAVWYPAIRDVQVNLYALSF